MAGCGSKRHGKLSIMFKSLTYTNEAGTAILAKREGAPDLLLERESGPLWEMVVNGEFGEIEPYVAPEVVISRQMVKAQAYKRIVTACPEWMQRNMTARAAILAEMGRDKWTADNQAQWDEWRAMWARIDAVRAASEAIEAMEPIPLDYADNKYWPE